MRYCNSTVCFAVAGVLQLVMSICTRNLPLALWGWAFLFQTCLSIFMYSELGNLKDQRLVPIGKFVIGFAIIFYGMITLIFLYKAKLFSLWSY